ncbi:MAG: hypothetical protein H7338_04900, partial [Candidatus Sericytochromatia bacterium]|nr:hypothetical protein [Candidatus Sericytochromatia bacterium]
MRQTKKSQIPALYPGLPDVEALARRLDTSPTYVANTPIDATVSVPNSDIFTSSRQPSNPCARALT